jgi:hypothetical protein
MQPEFGQRYSDIDKEQLIRLLEELLLRHPVLRGEVNSILEHFGEEKREGRGTEDIDEEVTEDWDFSGDETEPDKLPIYAQPVLHSKEHQDPGHIVEELSDRIHREQAPKALLTVLNDVIDEAISCAARGNIADALDLYILLFNARFHEQAPEITAIYDDMIDAAMPALEALLDEASSNALSNPEPISSSPLLRPEVRRQWLERLFTLWLKRLDALRTEEDLPEIILDLSWSEDVPFLRRLTQGAIQQPASSSNIIDFTRQYRTKALEKFLHSLPLPHHL